MRSLRTLTVLFVLLLLLPGVILAWLGWRSTANFAELAQAAAVATARDVATEVYAELPADELALEQRISTVLRACAEELAVSLPDHPAGAVMATANANLHESVPILHPASLLTLLAADGTAWLPCASNRFNTHRTPAALASAHLKAAGLEAASLEARGDGRAAVDRLVELTTEFEDPATLAAALAMAAGTAKRCDEPDADELCTRLAQMPSAAVIAAAPLSLVVLEDHAAARPHFTAAARSHALDQIPAPTTVRAAWYARAANADTYEPAQASRLRKERNPTSFVVLTTDLPADCTLELAVPRENWLVMLEPSTPDSDCTLELTASDATVTTPIRPEFGGVVSGTIRTRAGMTRLRVTNPAFADIARSSTRQRALTAIGITLLLTVMGTGVLLVRRSIASERAARRLRDDFIANVSHELKTPLTSIRMHAEMLSEAGIDDATRKRYGSVVDAESARLSSLVEDLLDFSALERGQRRLEPTPVDLTRAARATAVAWLPLADEAGIEMTVEAPSDPVLGMADTTALSRILTNLLQNAWRHGRPPRPSTGSGAGKSRIRICVRQSPAIEVRDNGPGIPPHEREQIFERFRRGSSTTTTDGSGIGLALSRELAEAIDGQLAVEDDGIETVFRLTLPPVPDQTPAPDPL